MNKFSTAVLTLLFPERCIFCNGVTQGNTRCCPKCEKRFRRKGDAVAVEYAGLTVYRCFYYKEQCKSALNRFKFRGQVELGDYFAAEMAILIEKQLGDFPFEQVVYLPMPELRERSRGYNQGKLLAQAVAARHAVHCDCCGLVRPEPFAQHDLNGSMRRKQSYGGFQIEEGTHLCGNVLLVDDVVTTGSSLVGCAQLLRQAGADKVVAITAAG